MGKTLIVALDADQGLNQTQQTNGLDPAGSRYQANAGLIAINRRMVLEPSACFRKVARTVNGAVIDEAALQDNREFRSVVAMVRNGDAAGHAQ